MEFALVRQFSERLISVRTEALAEQRRGQLLNIFIRISLIALVCMIGINVVEWWLQPSPSEQFYLISDGLCFGALVILWRLNSAGRTYLASFLFLLLAIMAVSAGSTPDTLDRIMVLYAFPVIASSFLLAPFASFLLAGLVWLAYSLMYSLAAPPVSYNDVSMIGLFVLAAIAWLMTRQLENALARAKQSKSEFETLVQSVGEGIGVVDSEGRFVFANAMADAIFGVTPGKLVGRQITEFVRENNASILDPETAQRQDGTKSIYELEIARPGGTIRHLIVTATPRTNNTGNFTGVFGVFWDVTAQKQTEEALRIAEADYRAIFDHAPVGIFQSTPREGRFRTVNPAMACIYGYDSPADMVSSVSNISRELYVDPTAREKLGQMLANDGQVFGFEVEDYRKDGSRIWTSMNVRAVKNADGHIEYYEGFTTDITARKRAETALREGEERFRLLFANNPLPMWVYDLQTLQFLEVNDAAVTHYGYSREEFLSRTLADIRPLEDVPELMKHVARERSSLQSSGGWRHRLKDGRLIDVEITSHQFEFAGHVAALVVAQDVTERKRAEQAQRESEERFRSLIESAPDPILMINDQGEIVLVNDQTLQVFGYARDELIGTPVEILVPESLRTTHIADRTQNFSKPRLGTVGSNIDLLARRKDGSELPVLISLNPMQTTQGVFVTAIVRDISERKKLENQIRQSEERYRAVTELVSDYAYAYRIDADGTAQLEWVTDAYRRITGYAPQEISGTGEWKKLIHPDDLEHAFDHTERIYAGQSSIVEYRIITKQGEIRWLRDFAQPQWDEQAHRVVRIYGAAQDITERKQAEEALRRSEERYRTLVEAAHEQIFVIDESWHLQYLNNFAAQPFGRSVDDLIGKRVDELFPPNIAERQKTNLRRALETGKPLYVEQPVVFPKTTMWLGTWLVPLSEEDGQAQAVMGVSRDITQRIIAEAKIKEHTEQLTTFSEIGRAVLSSRDLERVLQIIYDQVQRILPSDAFYICLYDAKTDLVSYPLLYDEGVRYAELPRPLRRGTNLSQTLLDGTPQLVNHSPDKLAPLQDPTSALGNETKTSLSLLFVPLFVEAKVIGAVSVQSYTPGAYHEEHLALLTGIAHQVAVAIENARLFQETRQRLRELEALAQVSQAMRTATNLEELRRIILESTLRALDAQAGSFFLLDPQTQELVLVAEWGYPVPVNNLHLQTGQGIAGECAIKRAPILVADIATDPRVVTRESFRDLHKAICFPIRTGDNLAGILLIAFTTQDPATTTELNIISTIADIASNAIQRMRSHELTQQHVQRLAALHTIDVSINGSSDLRFTLNIILEQVIKELKVDAATVLLLNPHSLMLECAATSGFRTHAIKQAKTNLHEDLLGTVVLEHRPIQVPDLSKSNGNFSRAPLLLGENLVSYFAVPLLAKGQVKGVLEVFQRTPFNPPDEWSSFLKSLAEQTAIAVYNAELFEELERSNTNLRLAYDMTIEGWSHALDLRDKETEGHTQRVTELALQLARTMGFSDAELVHIRRGALLHDIGKMGVPDHILLKPGPLTPEEWQQMRKHPQYAFDLLSPIPYLKPALDIPYAHHEKWDGTGYPRGLKGEQIPLSARIFAIVDVWDAMCSDRPYRRALPKDEIREHLCAQAGYHFDPAVVEAFLQLVKGDSLG